VLEAVAEITLALTGDGSSCCFQEIYQIVAQAEKMSNIANTLLEGQHLARFSPEINLPATFSLGSPATLPSFEVEPTRARRACTP